MSPAKAGPRWTPARSVRRGALVEDRAESPQHSLLVGPGGRGSAGGQVELAPVDVDVRLQPGQPELRRHTAHDRAERVESLADSGWSPLCEQRLDAAELHEGGRDLPVLRLAGLEPQVGAKRDRDERLELEDRGRSAVVLDDRRGRGVRLAVEREQRRSAPLAGEPIGTDRSSGRGADENLARAGLVLEPDRGGRRGPRDDQLAVARLDQEEVTGPRVDAGGHPEVHLADGAHRLPRALDEPLHLRGRAAGSLGVRVAGEENQERVSPELEGVAPVDGSRSRSGLRRRR